MPVEAVRHRLGVYARPRLLIILAFGFFSGLPLALTGTTLQLRLREAGVDLAAIGHLALIQLPYNLKALWAPVLDRIKLPVLDVWLGRRRAWLLIIQFALGAAILWLGAAGAGPYGQIVLAAAAVAFFSATQDIVIDAYRIELLNVEEQGAGAAATQMGYRLGMLLSGAGALYIASFFSWLVVYATMAAVLTSGVIIVLLAPRVDGQSRARSVRLQGPQGRLIHRMRGFISGVLPAGRPWLAILAFLLLYRLGSSIAEHMAMPLYHDLGFSKREIADIGKLLGTAATLVGVTIGGWLVYRAGVMPALLITGILQTLTNGLYIVLAHAGHDLAVLAVTITADNLAIGLNSAAIVAYLSNLCDREFTATQYALFSALMLLGRNLFASISGDMAQALGYPAFFAVGMILALPGLFLLLWLMRHERVAELRVRA